MNSSPFRNVVMAAGKVNRLTRRWPINPTMNGPTRRLYRIPTTVRTVAVAAVVTVAVVRSDVPAAWKVAIPAASLDLTAGRSSTVPIPHSMRVIIKDPFKPLILNITDIIDCFLLGRHRHRSRHNSDNESEVSRVSESSRSSRRRRHRSRDSSGSESDHHSTHSHRSHRRHRYYSTIN